MQLPRFDTFGLTALCTGALFAIAAWFPNDAVDLVAWLAAAVMGLPLSVVTYRHARGGAAPARWFTPAILMFLLRLFGTLVLLLGTWTLGWQVSSLLLRHAPEVPALAFILQALLPLALLGCGYRLLIRSVPARHTSAVNGREHR